MKQELICIACPMGCHLEVDIDDNYFVTGNQCKRGEIYGKKELTNPTRLITSTVKIKNGINNRIPVKSSGEVPKDKIFLVMKELERIELYSPVKMNEVVIENVCGLGVNIITTRSM
ncbi:molybdopterin oxidoreductase [Candidatus Izimaplasma bacterium ZiA1]|uniref:DUF1667 domain-containing protein n=1 Tax=Candidatus Izimoplasma sp. ZiA1 TaxID=2024899 RepID=UPI000BAA6B2F|nr:molybdopterin oxidoreductase [Candidatus Izimaplasma bacterium ZiA1]